MKTSAHGHSNDSIGMQYLYSKHMRVKQKLAGQHVSGITLGTSERISRLYERTTIRLARSNNPL